ncbi:hypothetical protein H072_441 [Dactylellina haptotyla CBS 200.50]|uniref:Uncharacterized protein n=2 Tax=Dactylellina haptotyla (strain CBS 200.50) TaxID=1284197 RepID=S8ARS7_DACHA|nr:hypothetical protein H072_441 [Dactylellina haptotyla CBS 200.50]
METTSIVLISVFSTVIVVLIIVVVYLVLHRKITIAPQAGWNGFTISQRRPFRDLFRRRGRQPIPRRGSDAWDDNISEEELGILRPTHSRAPSDPFQDPYDPYSPYAQHTRSSSYHSNHSTLERDTSSRARPSLPHDFSDDEDQSALPHYSAPPPAHSYNRPGTATPSTSAANTSQPRFTPTSSPPHGTPPPSIIHHIDSFRMETLETTITDIRLTLESANTILTQVSDLPDDDSDDDSSTPPLLKPQDLAKINELSSLVTYHEGLLEVYDGSSGGGSRGTIDSYTARLPKFKTLVAQGMAIIMAAERRRTRSTSHSSSVGAGDTFSSGIGGTFASFFSGYGGGGGGGGGGNTISSTRKDSTATTTSTITGRPQEVKKTQLLSRYADLKKTETFAKNSLRQLLERREARRGSPGSENREMELEVRSLGLRAFRERVALGRKLGVEDEDEEGEEVWGLSGVDGEIGGERVVVSPIPGHQGRRTASRTIVEEDSDDEPPLPPPAYDDGGERGRSRSAAEEELLDSKELR